MRDNHVSSFLLFDGDNAESSEQITVLVETRSLINYTWRLFDVKLNYFSDVTILWSLCIVSTKWNENERKTAIWKFLLRWEYFLETQLWIIYHLNLIELFLSVCISILSSLSIIDKTGIS